MSEPGWETLCPDREDRQHCNHWYDDAPCCACGDDGHSVCRNCAERHSLAPPVTTPNAGQEASDV